MYLQPSTTMENNTRKLAGQNTKSISRGALYHGIIARSSSSYQPFEKLLWKPSQDVSQTSYCNQMLLQINLGHQTLMWVTDDTFARPGDYHIFSLTGIQFHLAIVRLY